MRSLSRSRDAGDFIRAVKEARQSGTIDELTVEFDLEMGASAFSLAPIAATLDHYQSRLGVTFTLSGVGEYLEHTSFDTPLLATEQAVDSASSILDRVWRFGEGTSLHRLVERVRIALMERAAMGNDLPFTLEWCLGEVSDNVLLHSEAAGFLIAQYLRGTDTIRFCVADNGRGIYNSLKESPHHPRGVLDAVSLAVRAGVTRDANVGAGNGLWGLASSVANSPGYVRVGSGAAALTFGQGRTEHVYRRSYVSRAYPGTSIEFEMPSAASVSIGDILGYVPTDLLVERFEVGNGTQTVRVRDSSHGTMTREAGQALRNFVLNLLSETEVLCLDFGGVAVVTASFADELVGRLLQGMGFTQFQSRILIRDAVEPVELVINMVAGQRLAGGVVDAT